MFKLPGDFDNSEPWEPSNNDYVEIPQGIYACKVFKVEPKEKNGKRYYAVDFRIQGGEYDGEDVTASYVGLQPNTIFRLYEILKALGIESTYYNADEKKWIGIPEPEELQGKDLYVKVDFEYYHAKEKDGPYKYEEDGSAVIRNSSRPSRFFSVKEDAPAYRAPATSTVEFEGVRTDKRPYTPGAKLYRAGAAPAAGASGAWGAPVATPGATPAATGGTAGPAGDVPW